MRNLKNLVEELKTAFHRKPFPAAEWWEALLQMELCFLPPDDISKEAWEEKIKKEFIEKHGTKEDFVKKMKARYEGRR